jgi:transcriptional regulator with XRE-family HTH domain|nr:MAG TPA: helix-turn-helix XRE-family like protein [Caudoviricetes sp.]
MDLRVKYLIKQKGMTMQQFAEILGVTRDTLTRNINGNPTLETLERIANALGVDISELFVRNTPDSEVNGYVKVKGTLYEVHSFEDLRKLLEMDV